MQVVYTAIFVDKNYLIEKYPKVFPNIFYHHSTIEFRPSTINEFPIGENFDLKITGQLTTDKVDVLLVENPLSTNKHPHITLSTADGIKPFESNIEIIENLDNIEPLNDTVNGVYGVFDGQNDITSPHKLLNEYKNRFYQILNIYN